MEYKKIEKGSYNLHFIKTDKFKTTTVSVNFREPIKKEDITKRKLLFQMLTASTKNYNTSRLIEIKLEDLYSAGISFSTIKFGAIINSYIDLKFINQKYSDNKLLDEALDFLFEIIFSPNVIDNRFDEKVFKEEKERLSMIINSEKENTQKYTFNRALYLMDEKDPISYNLWGYQKDLDVITEENLYTYYKELLRTNLIDIFIVGDVDEDKIIKIFDEKFKINTLKRNRTEAFITYDKCPKEKNYTEELNIRQSHIAIICKILNLSLFERRYVLPLYSSILGGGGISRLFSNVREKESLAYTVMSMSNTPNSALLIYAGIDLENYEKALKLIKKEIFLKNVTEKELNGAKKEMLSSVNTLLDSTSTIINYYFGMEVFRADDIDTKIEKINKVTISDIEALSKKMKIAMTYLLKGSKNEKRNN